MRDLDEDVTRSDSELREVRCGLWSDTLDITMEAGLMTGSPKSSCMEDRPEVGLRDDRSSMTEGLWLVEEELEGRCTARGGRGGAAARGF